MHSPRQEPDGERGPRFHLMLHLFEIVKPVLGHQSYNLADCMLTHICWRALSMPYIGSPCHGHTSIGRPIRTYFDQLCDDSGCLPEDLIGAMQDRNGRRHMSVLMIIKTMTTMMIICPNDWFFLAVTSDRMRRMSPMQLKT